jgi:hypothetical protein
LKNKFDEAGNECSKTVEIAKGEFNKFSKELQGLDSKKKEDITQVRSKSKAKIETKINELKKKCDEKVDLETEESKKQDHKKALAT